MLKEIRSEIYGRAWLVECDCKDKTKLEIDTSRLVSGMKTHCGCRRIHRKKDDIKLPQEFIGKTKICKQCENEKEVTEFYITKYINSDSRESFRFSSKCIKCNKENAKNRILNNRDSHLKSLKINNARPETKEKVRVCGIRYRSGEKYGVWKDENAYRFKIYSGRHRIHDITESEWRSCLNVFANTCAYCGLPIEQHIVKRNGKYIIMKFHKEHVDDDGYNDLRNAVPACRHCNSSKHTSSLEDWYLKDKSFSIDRYIKILWWTNEEYKEYIEEKPPYRAIRKQNEGLKTFHWELWTVDKYRNMIELIYIGEKKKDITNYVKTIVLEEVE